MSAQAYRRPQVKTMSELNAMREAQGIINQNLRKEAKPEASESAPMAYFEFSRYTKGSFRGLFLVTQIFVDDGRGNDLETPIRKVIAEGVDMVVAMAACETALRKRVFK